MIRQEIIKLIQKITGSPQEEIRVEQTRTRSAWRLFN